MTDQNDPWPLVLGGTASSKGKDGARSGRRKASTLADEDNPFAHLGETDHGSGARRRHRNRGVAQYDTQFSPYTAPTAAAGSSAPPASPPSNVPAGRPEARGGRAGGRSTGIPQQQPSDLATGPTPVLPASAAPAAAPPTTQPGSPAARPRSRREALAAERAARATGEQRAVRPGDTGSINTGPVGKAGAAAAASGATAFVREPLYGPAATTTPPETTEPTTEPTTETTTGPTTGPRNNPWARAGARRRTGTTDTGPQTGPGSAPGGEPDSELDPENSELDPENSELDPENDGPLQAREPGPRRPPTTAERIGLPVLAALLALSAVSTLLPSTNGALVLLAAMAPLGALLAVPVIAVAAHHRQRVTAVVSGLAAVLPWALVVGYASGDPQPPADAPGVRIMLVNSNEGQVDAPAVVTALREHGVDLLVVNELTPMLAHELTKAGIGGILHTRYVSDQAGGTGPAAAAGQIGVWSRPDVTDTAPVAGTSLPAMTGTIQTPAGPIKLVAGHASRPVSGASPFGDASTWANDLAALAEAGSGTEARVLVGDLNATPWNQQFRRLEKTTGLSDAADALGKGLRPTWPVWSPMPLSPVDHVLVGGGVGVRSVGTVVISGSNHRAVVVEVTPPL